jgi:hypothetical protein
MLQIWENGGPVVGEVIEMPGPKLVVPEPDPSPPPPPQEATRRVSAKIPNLEFLIAGKPHVYTRIPHGIGNAVPAQRRSPAASRGGQSKSTRPSYRVGPAHIRLDRTPARHVSSIRSEKKLLRKGVLDQQRDRTARHVSARFGRGNATQSLRAVQI